MFLKKTHSSTDRDTNEIKERIELAEKWHKMESILLSFVTTNGELGTIANLEMHNIRKNENLTGHDEYLESVLKSVLPEIVKISSKYRGDTRLIVTTNQSILQEGEDFYLRIRVLSESDNLSGKLYFRPLGTYKYSVIDLKRMGSHVFEIKVPADQISNDFEYYIEVRDVKGSTLYPATARYINNSVIII